MDANLICIFDNKIICFSIQCILFIRFISLMTYPFLARTKESTKYLIKIFLDVDI
jgi:hypothetical protein